MPSQEYFDTLVQYYEEEVEGEAYFAEAAKAYDDPLVREKLELLAECERHAAESVEPLLRKYGLTPQSAQSLPKPPSDQTAPQARQTTGASVYTELVPVADDPFGLGPVGGPRDAKFACRYDWLLSRSGHHV